jgi:hypothetical protein
MKLDMHCEMLLNEYHEKLPIYEKMKTVVLDLLVAASTRTTFSFRVLKPVSSRSKA